MFLGLTIMFVYAFVVWLVFFKLKWIKFSIGWGIVSAFVGLHVLLIFLIGVRFVTPYSTNAKVIQHTIQLTPRLPAPALVTAVLVSNNAPVKKGQPLFEFDRRPYAFQVNGARADIAAAEQNVKELKAQLDAAQGMVAQARAQKDAYKAALDTATALVAQAQAARAVASNKYQIDQAVYAGDKGAISQLNLDQSKLILAQSDASIAVAIDQQAQARVALEQQAEAAIATALANEQKARLAYESQIDGVNTTVASLNAQLAEAQYYLDNTTMYAPEDGRIVNLQVREGMVAGEFRMGAIATFIADADRYVLATFNQENLLWVNEGLPVELAIDLYPGKIFKGTVKSIWRASGAGQMLPSGELPAFSPPASDVPQGQFAVQITLDGVDQSMFPIGAEGAAAIYTSNGAWAALRKIDIRGYTWFNYLYPLNV